MRPIQLTMTAFGPYKDTEVIDFGELEDHNLFVISGNTGSGKTTIFDGICFALYGTASGQDRENYAMLRSDFADDDTHTSVEFLFELNERIYRVFRQIGHVKEGNVSRTGERYEFYEVTEEGEVPCVDRQIVTEINKKVEELIGLTQDQFKQIVMLPQGEFRKLLTSETENKEAILRRLFKTEPYKHISEHLREKRNDLENEFKAEEQQLSNYIQSIHTIIPEREDSQLFTILAEEHYNPGQIIEGLQEEINYFKQKIIIDQKKYNESYQIHNDKQKSYHEAKAINDRFIELDEKEKQIKVLQAKETDIREKEMKLFMAEEANKIEPYEAQKNEWTKEEERQQKLLKNAKQYKKQVDEQLKKATEIFEKEKGNEEKREKIRHILEELKRHLPIVKDIHSNEKELQKKKTALEKMSIQFKEIETNFRSKSKQIKQHEEKMAKLEKETDDLQQHQERLVNLREKCTILKDYLTFVTERRKLIDEGKIVKESYVKAKDHYEKLEQNYFNNQAGLLAEHLHDGKACPVCGSLEHPDKALAQEDFISREELEKFKNDLAKKETAYRNALANYEANERQLNMKEKEVVKFLASVEKAQETYEDFVKQGVELKAKVEQLQKSREELLTLRKTYERAKKELENLEENKEQIDKQLQEEKSVYVREEAIFQERLRQIPEDVRVLSALEQKIRETEKEKLALEKAWEEAQKNLQDTKQLMTKATANIEHSEKQFFETKTKKTEAENKFFEVLKQANFFNEKVYIEAKMSIDGQKQLKQEIEQYKQNIVTLTKQIKELEIFLKDKTRVDLIVLEKELEQLKETYEKALTTLNLSKDYHGQLDKLKENIESAYNQVKDFEKQLAIITDLYDAIRGQNSRKISFERYLQIEYLEQIIEAANQRLRNLSNGQFLLMRSDRMESHGRQSGLGLDVYDSYTGQTRDVKTLSGGEKFNAALCLALGMSDVIQSFQGNISIKMMFIDEGFGSLDEESLNKAIDTLIELQQSGRMIGVISHVQELKTIFPAVLEVKKTNEGHSSTKFVIK